MNQQEIIEMIQNGEIISKRNWNNFIKVNVIFEKSKKKRFVKIINFFTIFENICQRELLLWYHRYVYFWGVIYGWLQLHYITNHEEIFDFSNKKNVVFMRLGAFRKRII